MSVVAGRSPTHVGGLPDDELVRLARGGYEPAFEAIVNRYRAPLIGYCRRWVDPHRAEEVVQHTLMKAFLCVRDDDRPLVLRPWLYRVAHNAALNALEKKGGDWEQLDENYDGVPQPPQVAEQRARFLLVVDEIESLPDRQREALVLNEFEGRCYRDIAAQLGTSESGVRGLLRRARRQLRETAAVLLPFPALRELVRSDAGRFQMDRAGEIIGSAGALGGASAAGGIAKVAAGVLAAGTIAGGGTAIEQHRDVWRAPAPQEASAPAAETPADGPLASSAAGPGAEDGGLALPLAAVPELIDGGHIADAFLPPHVGYGTRINDETAPAQEPQTEEPAPAPADPVDSAIPIARPPADEPADDEAEEPAAPAEEETASEEPPAESAEGGASGETAGETEAGPSATPVVPLDPRGD